ncbi:MAG: cytochrome c3 family protein [Proteobacteria bacterium]|nr:cytochrome c3 family protein [Pseudomonadota bacterium]
MARAALLVGLSVALGWLLPVQRAGAGEQKGVSVRPVSPVIFPEQRIPLRFSHVRHLTSPAARLPGDRPLTCESCHQRARHSQSSLDNLIPAESACRPCHAIVRATAGDAGRMDTPAGDGRTPATRCVACHLGYDAARDHVPRVYIPVPNIKFSHARHADEGIACTGCHGDLAAENTALATRDQLPSMASCLSCHDGKRAPSQCTTCHLAGAGGRIQTHYTSGVLAPSGVLYGARHSIGFRTDHRAAAQNNRDYCQNCHRKSECVQCHNGSIKPWGFHQGDYVTSHAIDARRNQPDCGSCHRSQTFCTGCHSRSGVSSDRRGSQFDSADGALRFHPAGWADATIRGPDHHAHQAQRNIRQCVACHREQFCVRCHTAELGSGSGLRGVNPHPPDWARSRRCRALLARNRRVCLRCHIEPDEVRCAG